jgi:quercetin dioxygenase-like cupin family protein
MRKPIAVVGVLVAAVAAFTLAIAEEVPKAEKPSMTFATPDKGTYAEMMPGVTQSVIWGDPTQGAYGAYTKFVPGFDAGMHTHTNDVWLVVLKGAYLYRDEAGDQRVGPGEFMRIAGGHQHWSGGDAKEGALFYHEGDAKFDLVHVE